MIRKALIIWAARLAAAQEHCDPHDPSEKADARRIERYITQLYPVNHQKHASDAKQLKQTFEALHYFYAPHRNILEPARHLKTDAAPRLPYLPSGAYYSAPHNHSRFTGWIASASAERWWRISEENHPPKFKRPPLNTVRYRNALRSAAGRASTIGSRFGPAPSWTSPLALVKYPFPLGGRDWTRRDLLRASLDTTLDIKSGYVEVEQFGGPRWAAPGAHVACPPVCGTWANVWRGTGVFLRLNRPLVAVNRLAAVVELVTQVSTKAGGKAVLESFMRQSPLLEAKVRLLQRAPRYDGGRRRRHGASLGESVAAAAADGGGGLGCVCLREPPICSKNCFNATEYAYDYVRVDGALRRLGVAGFLERVREGRGEDWCANVCGTGAYYHQQKAPWAALDAMLVSLSCLVGYDAVVLTRSPNDNGLVHQELVDFDVPVALGGWGAPPLGGLNDWDKCKAPFSNLPVNADALLLEHWHSTNKWALGDVARKQFAPCVLGDPGGDAWTSRLGRDRCRGGKGRTRRRGADVDRACFLTCRGHVSEAHANVSLTQVLRDDVVLCED